MMKKLFTTVAIFTFFALSAVSPVHALDFKKDAVKYIEEKWQDLLTFL